MRAKRRLTCCMSFLALVMAIPVYMCMCICAYIHTYIHISEYEMI